MRRDVRAWSLAAVLIFVVLLAGCAGVGTRYRRLPEAIVQPVQFPSAGKAPLVALDDVINMVKNYLLELILLLMTVILFWRLRPQAKTLEGLEDHFYKDFIDLKGTVEHSEWHFNDHETK